MSIRPFWIDADIDGRSTNLQGGPRAKDGQMHIDLKIREEGKPKIAYKIHCYTETNGKLKILICDSNGNTVHSTESDY